MSERPRLTTNEETLLANCERPMEMSEWREMTPDRQWGTLGLMRMDYWEKETTTGGGEEQVVANHVSPEPPHPKAPTAYWQYPKVEKGADDGKGKGPKGKDSK